MNKNTVYLLGAGASRGYVRSRAGVRAPLANDFFRTFSKLAISADLEVKIGFIVDYIRDTRGIAPHRQVLEFNENLEEVFAELDRELRAAYEATEGRETGDWVANSMGLSKAYDQFVFWFAHVLNEIQNGPPCPVYTRLVGQASAADTFVTFNWDTLLDRALFALGEWHPDDGYGVEFDGLLDGAWRDPIATESKFQLLKLHGSTNWLSAYVTRHLQTGERTWYATEETADCHWCLVDGSEHFGAYKNRWRPGYAEFSYFFPPNDPVAELPLMPILIPPVEVKQFHEFGAVLGPLWALAEKRLQYADRVVIAGYSFPVTDKHAFSLLDHFAIRRGKLIEIVDPYPSGVFERVSSHLGDRCEIIVHEKTLAGFLGMPDEALEGPAEEVEFRLPWRDGSLPRDAEVRMDWILSALSWCDLHNQRMDISTHDGHRHLGCRLVGEFSTHLAGGYREEVMAYRLNNIELMDGDGESVSVAIGDIWMANPISDEMTEESILTADPGEVDEGMREMIRAGFHCTCDEDLDYMIRRFVAS